MELHLALQRVLKFVAKGKDAPPILKKVRFFPSNGVVPSYVYATDGEVGVIIPSNIPCPDMALDSDMLAGPAKDRIVSVYLDEGGPRTVIFKSASDGGYALFFQTSTGHPMYPDYPTKMEQIKDWDTVQKVFHSALSKNNEVRGVKRPDLECVHFLGDRVEATDSYRMALVDVETNLRGQVPAHGFRHWPKGSVQACFTETHAWFLVDEELRFIRLRTGPYADGRDLREKFVPEFHDGPYMVFPATELKDICKRATIVSEVGQVILEFGIDQVTIRAQEEVPNFKEVLSGYPGVAGGRKLEFLKFLANGKFLDDALKTVQTPRVRICYGGDSQPLRVESGAFVECLWPKHI